MTMYLVSDKSIDLDRVWRYIVEGIFFNGDDGHEYTEDLTYVWVAHASRLDAVAYVLANDAVFISEAGDVNSAVEQWIEHRRNNSTTLEEEHEYIGFNLK